MKKKILIIIPIILVIIVILLIIFNPTLERAAHRDVMIDNTITSEKYYFAHSIKKNTAKVKYKIDNDEQAKEISKSAIALETKLEKLSGVDDVQLKWSAIKDDFIIAKGEA